MTRIKLIYQAVEGFSELMDLYNKIWNISEEDTELLAVNSGLSAPLTNACQLVSIIISNKFNDY